MVFQDGPWHLSSFLILLSMLLLQGALFLGIPYVRVRRSMQQTAYELERDLFYFVQRSEQAQPTNA